MLEYKEREVTMREFELNGVLTYLSNENDKFFIDYLSIMSDEAKANKSELNNLKRALNILLMEIYKTNELYIKHINKEIRNAKIYDFVLNTKHNSRVFDKVAPAYINELMQVKKLIYLLLEYLNKITLENNNFGLTDIFIMASVIMNLSEKRFKELQRQVNIYYDIEDDMMDFHNYSKNYSNKHIDDSLNYLLKTLKKSI